MSDDEELLQLRARIKELGLFGPTGKYRHSVVIPADLQAACFAATPNCLSPELKDRLYWVIHGIRAYPTCATCSKPMIVHVKNFGSAFKDQRYCNSTCRLKDPAERERYAVEREARTGYRNPLQDPAVKAKVAATNLERYGIDNPLKAPEIRRKASERIYELYGVDNVARIPAVRRQAELTMQARYGAAHPQQVEEFRSKARKTNLERYGAEYPAHTEKGRRTCLARYGVRHPMQDFNIFQRALRSRFKLKTLTTPSGAELKYQGYEDVALRLLLSMGVHEVDILTNRADMPRIFYHGPTGRARYYPDIYVKSLNLLIEVKSPYTLNLNRPQAFAKQRACQRLGYHHLLLVCDKRSIIQIYD